MRQGRRSLSLVTDSDDFSGDEEQSMGVNCMLEVSLVRRDDVPSVSRKRERRYPFHKRYCCGRGRGPLGDRKKLLACPVACDAPRRWITSKQ